jgi:uncharacterized membrane protein (UPF0136 family)
MLEIARIWLYVFGAITIAGGVMGFVKAKSKASLIAGGIAGALLIGAALLFQSGGRNGVILGLVVSLALAGRFVGVYRKSKKVMPAGVMALLSVISVALLGAALAMP